MIYNKDLFKISEKLIIDNPKLQIQNKKLEKLEKKFVNALIEKISEKMEYCEIEDGILKIEFEAEFYVNAEEGYDAIRDLRKMGKLSYVLNKYNCSLEGYNEDINEWNSGYYKIAWDYRRYYNECKSQNQTITYSDANNKSLESKQVSQKKKTK